MDLLTGVLLRLLGWVVQPSFLQDPEHRTLLLWARERLQQAVKQRYVYLAKDRNLTVAIPILRIQSFHEFV